MANNSNHKTDEKAIHRLENRFFISFVILVALATGFITAVILYKSEQALTKNALNLIETNSSQLQININSYLDKAETTAALLFADEVYYTYDETDPSLDEYTKIQYENTISDRIVDIGIMQNFSDFGIVYSDNKNIGWISNTTKAVFDKDNIYDEVSAHISNEKTQDGWFFGHNENYDRLYYVKRINDNAVLVTSIYTRELAGVFKVSDELSNMAIRLINDDKQIVCSSFKGEAGEYLPEDIASYLSDANTQSMLNKDYIITLDTCENGWRVVCTMPTDTLLADSKALRHFAIVFAALLSLFIIWFGFRLITRLAKPVDRIMLSLEKQASTDGLSGLINKVSFEENVSEILSQIDSKVVIMFIIIDMDHFKNINDTLGHKHGDEVIQRTAEVIRLDVPKNVMIGRIGGDEFAMFYANEETYNDEVVGKIKKRLDHMTKVFLREFSEEHDSCQLSLSYGVVVKQYDGETFEDLYKMADKALYVSKNDGRGRYTFYDAKKEGLNDD